MVMHDFSFVNYSCEIISTSVYHVMCLWVPVLRQIKCIINIIPLVLEYSIKNKISFLNFALICMAMTSFGLVLFVCYCYSTFGHVNARCIVSIALR